MEDNHFYLMEQVKYRFLDKKINLDYKQYLERYSVEVFNRFNKVSFGGRYNVADTVSRLKAIINIPIDKKAYQIMYHIENAHEEEIRSIQYDPIDKLIISGSNDMSIKIHQIDLKKHSYKLLIHIEKAHEGKIHTIKYNSISKLLFTAAFDESMKVYKIEIEDRKYEELIHIRDAHKEHI